MDRSSYPHFLAISTRWKDNDVYGHVNNVEYYSFFDTVINDFLIRAGELDIHRGDVIGLCVESQCTFKQSLAFPGTVDAGLRVSKLGNSSVHYDIGLFASGHDEPAATGRFVHVFVGREDRRPVPLPGRIRAALEGITG
jgi:acyl-CoA thioester hydrolase